MGNKDKPEAKAEQVPSIYRDTIEQELDRNERLVSSKKIRESLVEFATDLKVQNGLTDHRIMFYLIRLRVLSRMESEEEFLNPSIAGLKKVIMKLSGNNAISPRTVEDYKQAIRKYYSWKLPPSEFAEKVGWIHVKGNSVNRLKKSEDMITRDEIERLITACANSRDKALFSTLYDSGCRVGEILTLRIRDLQNDKWGTLLHVTGKTGERMVRIVGDSVPYLREWVRNHPNANDPDSMVFVSISGTEYGKPMTYDEMIKALRRAKKRADITRRIHPHLFRHTRASILAAKVAEAPLEAQMGWVHGSRQTRTYVHLSAKDQDREILKANGLDVGEEEKEETPRTKTCPRCGELNPSNSTYCRRCWLPLNIEEALKQTQRLEKIETAMQVMGMDGKDKERLGTFGPEAKLELLTSLLIDMEKTGQLDQLKKVISAMGNNKNE